MGQPAQVVVLQMRRIPCQKQGKILFLESVFFVLGLDSVFAPVLGACVIKASVPASCCSQVATSEGWIDPLVEFGAAAVARGMQPPWGLAATTVLLILVANISTNVALRVVSALFVNICH